MPNAKCWFEIKARKTDAAESEILLYDEIGYWGVRAQDFVEAVRALGESPIHLRINSPGGDVLDAFAIYNYLRDRGGVRVTIDGIAASAASVVAMAGEDVTIADNGFLMIHNPFGVVVGGSKDMRDLATVLDKITDGIVKAYARKTDQPKDKLKKWMDDETWFTAEEAKEFGFADTIDDAAPAKNFALLNMSGFKKAPAALLNRGPTPSPVDIPPKAKMKTIEELQAQLAKAEADLKTANDTRDQANQSLVIAKGDLAARDKAIETRNAELKAAQDGKIAAETKLAELQKDFDAKLTEAVAAGTAKAVAALNEKTPLPAVPPINPAAPKPEAKEFGLKKVQAAFKAQLTANRERN
jgi:ATP-dependent protease ClpP protease subunit